MRDSASGSYSESVMLAGTLKLHTPVDTFRADPLTARSTMSVSSGFTTNLVKKNGVVHAEGK